ncbi:hypothetical protein L484_027668 [Morus notabilis]|uniref:Uncharacterized protein n=1 Tax=Morus notabilis TaxID=981085 RepID=W9RCM7_9ROSA|nr:hypothetical protein L484_027668 [Morus notabilis]
MLRLSSCRVLASAGRDYIVVLALDVGLQGAAKAAVPLNHVACEFGPAGAWMAWVNHAAFDGLAGDGLHDGAVAAAVNLVAAGFVGCRDGGDTVGSIGPPDGLDVAPMERVQAGDLLGVAAFAFLDASSQAAPDQSDGTGLLYGVAAPLDWLAREDGLGLDPILVTTMV